MVAKDPFETEPSDFQPTRVGRYVFRRPLAAGGLGVVSIYYDTELDREVALKEIRSDCADEPRQRESFCAEAQVTGILEHPGVVPVYSRGTADDGRPYYAMRLISGSELRDHITKFHNNVAKGNEAFVGPALRNLIQRLIDVCNVIHYAHSRGVLHRDLKSINVMLGKYGETIVIDWGLAKTTGESEIEIPDVEEQDATATESPVSFGGSQDGHTRQGTVMGTVSYAPPEQLNGRTHLIDARSDVYCLGSILYEILTGAPPCHGKNLTQALRAIESKQIPSPHEAQPRVPKPLSAIAVKAIEPQSDRRYQSAKELRQDLQRWLDDERVTAYRESKLEKLSRWKRRHEVFVRWASIALATITLISLVATYQINAAKNQVENARSEATRMLKFAREATDSLLTRTSDRLEDLPGGTELRLELLRDAGESYKRMTDVRSSDPELRRESARAALGLSEVQLLSEAREEGIQTLRSGMEALTSMVTPEDQILRARLLTQLSRFHEPATEPAEQTIMEAIEITKQQIQVDPSNADVVLAHGGAIWQRGIVAADQALMDDQSDADSTRARAEAIQAFESASDLLRSFVVSRRDDEARRDASLLLVKAYNNEAVIRSYQSNLAEDRIMECYRKAIENSLPYVENSSKSSAFVKEYALATGNLAENLLDSGDLTSAKQRYELAVQQFTALEKKYHAIPMYKDFLALAQIGLGHVALRSDDVQEAINHYASAVELSDALLEQSKNDDKYHQTALLAKSALGSLLSSNVVRAETLLDEALALDPGSESFVNECRISLLMRVPSQDVEKVRALASSISQPRDIYNVACVMSRTCRQLAAGASSEPAETIDAYLDIAVERLNDAIAKLPELSQYVSADNDLEFLRERRGSAIQLKPSTP